MRVYSMPSIKPSNISFQFLFRPCSQVLQLCVFPIHCVMLKYKGRYCCASTAFCILPVSILKDKRNYKVSLASSWLCAGQPFFNRFWIVHFLLTKLAVSRQRTVYHPPLTFKRDHRIEFNGRLLPLPCIPLFVSEIVDSEPIHRKLYTFCFRLVLVFSFFFSPILLSALFCCHPLSQHYRQNMYVYCSSVGAGPWPVH